MKVRVLRVLTLASGSGRYGGPYETSLWQRSVVEERGQVDVKIMAGHLRDDPPTEHFVASYGVRRWLPVKDFLALFSLPLAAAIVRGVRGSQVVHVSFAREVIPVFAAIVALLARKPLVLQPHGMLTTSAPRAIHRLVDLLMRPIFRRATNVIALTEVERSELRDWVRSARPMSIDVLGNPGPVLTRTKTTRPHTVLFAARLHPRKRVVDFVAAAELARQDSRYVVAGPDQGDLGIVQTAVEKGRVDYVGALHPSDLKSVLAGASVFVLPSRGEPWGNVLATALRSGIPVVVTESSALASAVRQLPFGRVVADERPEEIADAVDELIVVGDASAAPVYDVAEVFSNVAIASGLSRIYSEASRVRPRQFRRRGIE